MVKKLSDKAKATTVADSSAIASTSQSAMVNEDIEMHDNEIGDTNVTDVQSISSHHSNTYLTPVNPDKVMQAYDWLQETLVSTRVTLTEAKQSLLIAVQQHWTLENQSEVMDLQTHQSAIAESQNHIKSIEAIITKYQDKLDSLAKLHNMNAVNPTTDESNKSSSSSHRNRSDSGHDHSIFIHSSHPKFNAGDNAYQ
ncbi:hypothetical protein BGZ76_004678 [Entomortierella beljakovae]|nr:hypothetical protein BGZ76_004678 [Entomortierella beljakovae]